MITVDNLCKDFIGRKRIGRRFLLSAYAQTVIPAVKNISFHVAAGERVAFIGPNGAGKSTTLKMLSGILQPTAGHAVVAGHVPWEARRKLAYEIGLVFGQRSQLWYHLPALRSFDLLGKIYGLEEAAYQKQLGWLTDIFHLQDIIQQPVRSLSLGQRMRCEIAASLLHSPKVLFLDEPTIGLDVTAKAELRDHLCTLGEENGTTIILTSHDTDDIEKICPRVILINHGEKLIDMPLVEMRRTYLRRKQIVFATAEETPALDMPGAQIEPHRVMVEIDPEKTSVPSVITKAMQQMTVHDITVGDVPLEDVIKHIYHQGAA